jgi:hypothetical protein
MNGCKRTTGRMLAIFATSAAGLMLSAMPASAQLSGPTIADTSCMQKVFGGPTVSGANQLNCTANDIRLSAATSVSPTSCTAGTHFNLTATFTTVVTANSRYDAAFYFNTGGGANARDVNGTCSVSQLNNGGPGLNLDGDTCGDLNSGTYNVTFTIPNVLCTDTDGDGFLNLPNCTAWHSNQGTACILDGNPSDANPDTKSKCVCDDKFQVPVTVETGKLVATKDVTTGTLSSRPEPGGQFSYTISVQNTSTVQTITLDSICDDKYGQIAYLAGPACPTVGNIGTIDGTTCSLGTVANPVVLQPGDSTVPPPANSIYTCTFTASVLGGVQTVTDTVTFTGHDGQTPPKSVSATDSAQVSITDTPANASVVKSLVGIACADVNYGVKITNTDAGDASITLSAIDDDTFGSLTSVPAPVAPVPANTVLSTTCSVPQTIAKADATHTGVYECSFKAHFCGGSHQNTVSVKVHDDDNPGTDLIKSSNTLTVNVNATVGP